MFNKQDGFKLGTTFGKKEETAATPANAAAPAADKPALFGGFKSGGGILGKTPQKDAKSDKDKEAAQKEFQNQYKKIADKKVGELLTEYEHRVEEQAKAFQAEAEKIAKADVAIFECLGLIEFLEERVKELDEKQKALQKDGETVCQKQKDFINKMKEETQKNAVQTEDKRQKMWDNAHRLGEEFVGMEDQIKRLVEQFDGSRLDTNAQSDIRKVTKVANHHLSSLMWIDSMCKEMEQRLAKINQ